MKTWIINHKNHIVSAFSALCLCAVLAFFAVKREDNGRAALLVNGEKTETEESEATESEVYEDTKELQDEEKAIEPEAIEVGGEYKNGKLVTKTIKNVFDLNTLLVFHLTFLLH